MSTELINRITVKKDGVYISSHSSNDTAPFHSWRCKGLSEIYAAEGQKGLDREIVCMLYEYAQLRGSHKSLRLYFDYGLTYEQIGKIEGCSKMPVKRSIDRAIEKIREKIKYF